MVLGQKGIMKNKYMSHDGWDHSGSNQALTLLTIQTLKFSIGSRFLPYVQQHWPFALFPLELDSTH
mgnify:CR=1 FL=1